MRLALLAALLLTATPALAQDEMVTLKPAQFGEIFCIARLGNDMGPVTGILTPALTEAIAEAEAKNAEWEAANPGEKPPLGDGIPWQAWQDYAPECTVGDVSVSSASATATVELRYAFPDSPDADFTDTLQLALTPVDAYGTKAWRIDNIAYSTGGDLRATLRDSFTGG